MKKYLLFPFLLATLFTSAQTEKSSIQGIVLNQANQQALEFVNVVAFYAKDSSLALGVITDLKGGFRLDRLKQGNYYVLFKFIGFKDTIVSNVVLSDKQNNIDLGTILLHSSTQLNEVVVKNEEKLIENKIDRRIYNVDQDLTAKGSSLTDVLNNVPSVEVDQDGNVSLRGNSGVNILIDGRQSVGTKSSLQTIPASSIERIEIINNPSAKYNPEGMAGIINIVLKKNKLRGMNGNVNLSYASGNLFNGSVGLNARNRVVNFFANYSYRKSYGISRSDRQRTDSELDFRLMDQLEKEERVRQGHTAKLGADFTLAKQHILGVSISGMMRSRDATELATNSFFNNNTIDSYFERKSDENNKSKNFDANLNYQWKFKKDKGNLSFDFTESMGQRTELGYFNQYYYDSSYTLLPNSSIVQQQNNPSKYSIFSARVDFLRNFAHNIKFEAGGKLMVDDDRSVQYRETYQDALSAFTPDLNINNNFKVNRTTYAAYGIFAQKVKQFSYQVGLRVEQTAMHSVLFTTNQSHTNNYLSLFPSAYLSYELPKKGKLNLSYSRRIDRPSNHSLNPFPSYSDPYNLRQGNPFLLPEYINSFELTYMKDWKKLSLILTGYFKQSKNALQRVVEYLPNNVAVSTYANYDQKYNYGAEAVIVYKPFEWWRNTLTGNVYQTAFKDSAANTSGFGGSFKLMTSFNFWKKTTTVQLNARYFLAIVSPQGKMRPTPAIDLSFQRSFLKGKLTLGARVSDIFNTRGFKFDLVSQGVRQVGMFKWQTQRFYLTLGYKFGKLVEGRNQRRGGSPQGDGGGGDMGF